MAAALVAPWRRTLPWLALFVAALALRALHFGLVFRDGEVQFPFGVDELYHLRRIWFSVVNFPATLDFDAYMNFPAGAPPIWSPFFDWTIAALARGLVGAGDQRAVEVVAAWVPPLLGAFAVLAAMVPVRRAYGSTAGWWTGFLLLTAPAHVFLSDLGQVDHHVAVGLVAALLVAAAMRLAVPPPAGAPPRGAVATGIVAAVAVLLWAGALLHVLVIQAFLALQALAGAEREAARARARALAVMHAVAALGVAPYCLGRSWEQFGAFTPEVHSNLQPLWFAAGAAAFAAVAWGWARDRFGATRLRRIGSALALAAVGTAAAWALVPGLAEAVRSASGWFADDPFLERILELRPLLVADHRFTAEIANERLSYLFWTLPVALAALGWRAARAGRSDRQLLLVASTAALGAALVQQRFLDVAVFGYAWVLGPAIAGGLAALRGRWTRLVAAVAVGALALLPGAFTHRAALVQSLAAMRGEEPDLHPIARSQRAMRRAAEWIRRETPPTRGYLAPDVHPEYGVLTSWDTGHLVRYYAERPMVQDNFGPWGGRTGFDAARRYYDARDEVDAIAIAERLGVRYVVMGTKGSGQGKPHLDAMARRLHVGRQAGGSLGFDGEALSRHRLVHLAGDAGRIVAVYELVPGARVVGEAPAEAVLRFEQWLHLPGHPPLFYARSVRADARGRYEVTLPYPAGYVARLDGVRESLRVSEEDVRAGRTLEGPRFPH